MNVLVDVCGGSASPGVNLLYSAYLITEMYFFMFADAGFIHKATNSYSYNVYRIVYNYLLMFLHERYIPKLSQIIFLHIETFIVYLVEFLLPTEVKLYALGFTQGCWQCPCLHSELFMLNKMF